MQKSVEIRIYGQRYTVKASSSQSYIKDLANYVDRKMREMAAASKVNSLGKVAVLTALNIADELHQQQEAAQKKEGTLRKTEKRVSDMIQSIEKQFEGHPSS